MNREKIVEKAKSYLTKHFQSKYLKQGESKCADFVSTVLTEAGWTGTHVTYVPNFFNVFNKVSKPQPGDLIIFDRTYDAVKPSGIGPEDDMTHVGIVINDSEFIHWSSSLQDAAKQNIADWSDLINCYLDVKADGQIKKQAHIAQADYDELVANKIASPGRTDLDKPATIGEVLMLLNRLRKLFNTQKVDPSKDFSFDAIITIKGEKKK